MRKVTLGLGLCDCIVDWHGKFNGHRIMTGNISFRLAEEIVCDGRNHRNHIWIDRHYHEPWVSTPEEYETIIEFKMGHQWQPDQRYHPEDIFATSYIRLSSQWWWSRKPSIKEVVGKIERMLKIMSQTCDFEEWLNSFKQIAHFPLLG